MNPYAASRRLSCLAGVFLIAAAVQGCVSRGTDSLRSEPTTANEQFRLETESRTEALHFRINPQGLSDNQRLALDQVAGKAGWEGGQPVDVIIQSAGSPEAVRAGHVIREYLLAGRVPASAITYSTSDAQPQDVVTLNLVEYRTVQIDCNQKWENLARTASNRVHSNFGCATIANMAAQIADPRDIAAPQPSTPSDAGRKVTIIDKYRKGEVTSAADNQAAKGTISDAIK